MRQWRRLPAVVVGGVLVLGTADAQGPGEPGREAAVWRPLRTRTDLSGWTRIVRPPTTDLSAASPWRFCPSTRVLSCSGHHGHELLRWNEPTGDFVPHVEWRFVRRAGERRNASGVFVRFAPNGQRFTQAQAAEAGGWLVSDRPENGAKVRVNLNGQMSKNRVRPAGGWNIYGITAQGSRVSLWVNGVTTSTMESAGRALGHVGLEAGKHAIEFRNIKLKRLAGRQPHERDE